MYYSLKKQNFFFSYTILFLGQAVKSKRINCHSINTIYVCAHAQMVRPESELIISGHFNPNGYDGAHKNVFTGKQIFKNVTVTLLLLLCVVVANNIKLTKR